MTRGESSNLDMQSQFEVELDMGCVMMDEAKRKRNMVLEK